MIEFSFLGELSL